MPHPVPELQEILALEAKVHADLYDLYPPDVNQFVILPDGEGARLEAHTERHRDILYIKKS